MNILNFIKSFGKKTESAPKPPDVGMSAHPMTINPGSASRIERTKIRYERVRQAYNEATDPAYKAKMKEAMERHGAALRASGIKVGG